MSRALRSITIQKRLLSSISDSSKALAEKSVILGPKPTKQNQALKQKKKEQVQDDSDLKFLDESIKRADLLSQKKYKDPKEFSSLPNNYAENQMLDIDLVNTNELASILWKFDAPIRYSFAYGSGVFNQGYHTKDTQTDLILAVTYPEHWHSINMKYNPHHYSTLRYFGSGAISKFQEIGAGVYFNPFVEIDGKLVKYGVVSVNTLVKDLAKWNSFYLAGRLQKPVKILRDDPMIRFWNQQNLRSAATLAYLNLPKDEKFNEVEFYKKISELSYKGDIRYKLGAENPNKINNIVEKNFEYFQKYYSPILSEIVNDKRFSFQPGFTKENANQKLQDTIFRTSTLQTVKGLFTAGISKSIKYAIAKKMKASQ